MTHYAKKTTTFIASASSDYSDPVEHEAIDALTPDEYVVRQIVEVGTTAMTYRLDHLGTCTDVIIENTDATNYLLATVRIQKATKTFSANKLGFLNQNPDLITDDDSTFVSALYAADGDVARVTNANTGANNNWFQISEVTAGVMSLTTAGSLTNEPNDPGTPTIAIQRDITLRVGPGQSVTVCNVLPEFNLTLIADTAAVVAKISYAGT